jgi:hypothetical protein
MLQFPSRLLIVGTRVSPRKSPRINSPASNFYSRILLDPIHPASQTHSQSRLALNPIRAAVVTTVAVPQCEPRWPHHAQIAAPTHLAPRAPTPRPLRAREKRYKIKYDTKHHRLLRLLPRGAEKRTPVPPDGAPRVGGRERRFSPNHATSRVHGKSWGNTAVHFRQLTPRWNSKACISRMRACLLRRGMERGRGNCNRDETGRRDRWQNPAVAFSVRPSGCPHPGPSRSPERGTVQFSTSQLPFGIRILRLSLLPGDQPMVSSEAIKRLKGLGTLSPAHICKTLQSRRQIPPSLLLKGSSLSKGLVLVALRRPNGGDLPLVCFSLTLEVRWAALVLHFSLPFDVNLRKG